MSKTFTRPQFLAARYTSGRDQRDLASIPTSLNQEQQWSSIDLVLDESVDTVIEQRLNALRVKTIRPEKGVTDELVLQFAITKEAPLLTRDQSDYVVLNNEMQHYGILLDKQLHLRDGQLVAETASHVLEEYQDQIKNELVYLSNFYGVRKN